MSSLSAIVSLLRTTQWLKNLMLFFPPFLGGSLFQEGLAAAGLLPFVVICIASGASYIVNDIADRDRDREHPVKKLRPLPSGSISILQALMLAGILLLSSVVLAWSISGTFFLLLAGYLTISVTYSFAFKRYPVIDLFCISSGFLLRLLAGGEAFGVVVSEWLFLSVFLLALFLSTGKRYSEKKNLGERAGAHRTSLLSYPDGFLDGAMFMTGATVLVTYTMYVVSRHSLILLYTVPLCCFGLLRYLLRVFSGMGGDPTESLVRDIPLFIVASAWVLLVGWGIYGS
jgi:4-hydroxybenzoate polyprenyltransferase